MESHPLWVRGLKHLAIMNLHPCVVASFMGAWVETYRIFDNLELFQSHPLWVRGLKPLRT